MKPKKQAASACDDLFRMRQEQMLDQRHVLCQLAGKIDWSTGREQMKEQMVKNLKRLRSAIQSF